MRTRLVPLFAAVLVSACAADGEPGLEGPDDIDDSALVAAGDAAKADSLNQTATYYLAVRDTRRCMWPSCGGWFVNRVNREWTHCNDGKWRNACYVVDMDHSRLGLSADEVSDLESAMGQKQIVLRGGLVTKTYAGKRLGQFRTTEAWRASTAAAPSGEFYKVTDKQIVCIVAPCPSLHEAKLNSTLSADIHALDLDRVGGETLTNQAFSAMESGPIVVAGTHSTFVAASGKPGTTLDGSQLYTRVQHQALAPYAPSPSELAGRAFADPTGARPVYPRTYRFDASGATVRVEDAVAPCAPGAVCIWSGIVSRPATWSLAGDRVRLAYTSAANDGYSIEYFSELQVKKDAAGALVLVEVLTDGLSTTNRAFRDSDAPAE